MTRGGRRTPDRVTKMTVADDTTQSVVWQAVSADEVATTLGVEIDQGLDASEVDRRLAQYGPNALPTEPPPSVWTVARGQLSNPMNIMLIIVSIASFSIGQIGTGILVAGLVTFNVVMGSIMVLKD